MNFYFTWNNIGWQWSLTQNRSRTEEFNTADWWEFENLPSLIFENQSSKINFFPGSTFLDFFSGIFFNGFHFDYVQPGEDIGKLARVDANVVEGSENLKTDFNSSEEDDYWLGNNYAILMVQPSLQSQSVISFWMTKSECSHTYFMLKAFWLTKWPKRMRWLLQNCHKMHNLLTKSFHETRSLKVCGLTPDWFVIGSNPTSYDY